MPLLLLLYPFLELYLIVRLFQAFGFLDILLFMISTGALGALIMSLFGKALLMEAQSSFVQGKIPESRILHRVLMFLGGLFIFLPGIISDVTGILLILPGSRHLAVFILRAFISKAMAKGAVNFVKFGNSGFSFRGGFASARPFDQGNTERDAKVIDVQVIDSKTYKIENKSE